MPEPDGGSPIFLDDVVSPPALAASRAITTRKERYVSTATLNQRKYWESGRQIADDAGSGLSPPALLLPLSQVGLYPA
jgi:hypothetical protein